MAARARRASHPVRGVKNVLRRQLGRALADLDVEPMRDVTVHEARKELKRARSTLRMLRCAIGDAAYRRANRQLRDAGRPLARVRNAKALLDVTAEVRTAAKDRASRTRLASIERQQRSERRKARAELLHGPGALREVRRSIRSVLSGSPSWPSLTHDSLRDGIERMYRKGRKAYARAAEEPCNETLHESRKQTKYLGKALQILGAHRSGAIAKRAKRAKAISDALGDDHDLAMLQGKLARGGAGADRRTLDARIERRRHKLQRKAVKKSRRLYRRKAKAFIQGIESL
jgi:CHAD domain-containing protein